MEKIKVGIIGSGYGARVILPCFNAVSGVHVFALAGRDVNKIKPLADDYGVPHILNSLDEMLGLKELDLVCIATPPYLHVSMVDKTLKHEKHVLCEKPLALDRFEAKRLMEAALRTKSVAVVDHQLRFHPNFRKIKSIIESGLLGQIYHVDLSYHTSLWLDKKQPWSWWSDDRLGGGELNAIGSHFVDILLWLFGNALSITCSLNTFIKERLSSVEKISCHVSSDDYVACQLKFENGINASLVLSSVSLGGPDVQIRITGKDGALLLNGFERLTIIKDGEEKLISEKDPLESEPVVGINPWRRSLVRYAEHIADCLQEKKQILGTTFQEAYKTQLILDAARLSHCENRRVFIKEIE